MTGKIRTKEICPKCEQSFEGNPLRCPTACLTIPKKYFIDFYHKGYGRLKIYSDKTGHPLDSFARAQRVLDSIRYEVDQHIFNPEKYIKADLKQYLFETRIEAWYHGKIKEVEKGNLAPSYTKELRRYTDRFYLPYFKGKDVREIRTFHITEFYDNVPSSNSLKYTKNILNALENFFNTLLRNEFITQTVSFPSIRLERKSPKWLDRKTQNEVLQEIPETDRPLYTFLSNQGIRPGEARALKVKDLDFENGIMIVCRTYSGHSKLYRDMVKNRIVRPRALNPNLIAMLKKLCKDKTPDAFVFINPRMGTQYSYSSFYNIWKKVRNKKQIEVTPYQATRHSFATNAFKDGADLKSIGDILGHTDIRTTLKYAHSDIDNQHAVFKKQHAAIMDFVPRVSPAEKKK